MVNESFVPTVHLHDGFICNFASENEEKKSSVSHVKVDEHNGAKIFEELEHALDRECVLGEIANRLKGDQNQAHE